MKDILKALTFLIAPSGFLIAGTIVSAAVAIWRRSNFGAMIFFGFAVLLAVAAFLPVGRLCLSVIEHRFPRWQASDRAVAGIVMLDGKTERLPFDLAFAHRYPHARVIFSGRQPGGRPRGDNSQLLLAAGLDPHQVQFEGQSRDTYENARFSKELAKPRPGELWLLVTSAAHMPRAMAAFRAADFPVVAAPVDFRTNARGDLINPSASNKLSMCDEAFREILGLSLYRLTGRTRELWPKP